MTDDEQAADDARREDHRRIMDSTRKVLESSRRLLDGYYANCRAYRLAAEKREQRKKESQ
jgi:hypothetical protein